ncbi:hypothetical protein GCK72_021158 [Caenorhabditis remanei]|uniref:Uncharacterized protein n=1 Tax=Caenorhabditis remanei TaxID=31234 RepID=A0A6A5GJ47_CAERE|nr:hypothetical protein GCK72_021158 [Caenorhabditis remanei]KAF1754595.1 hypothetical protein GCK72_021158 [Caenorhabditis remanei]
MTPFFLTLLIPMTASVKIFTKTMPAQPYNLQNIPLETNMRAHFQGYDPEGQPIMTAFWEFEDMLMDTDLNLHVSNRACVCEIIAPNDMLMQCQGRLYRVENKHIHVVAQVSEHFAFDHVMKHIYVYAHDQIVRLQPHMNEKSVPVWNNVKEIRDFNVVSGLLTTLHSNGTILFNGTILGQVDPASYSRLPIFAAPNETPQPLETSIYCLVYFLIGSLSTLIMETCGQQIAQLRGAGGLNLEKKPTLVRQLSL